MPNALVLGGDLTPDGLALGPQSIIRLERGLRFASETGYQLVVAAGFSPRHRQQSVAMSVMMHAWLCAHGYRDAIVLTAKQFRTKGEVAVFMTLPEPGAIISDEIHLCRTCDMVVRLYGEAVAEQLLFVPTDTVAMTKRGQRLEPLKRFYIRHIPLALYDAAWHAVTWATVKFGINLSY